LEQPQALPDFGVTAPPGILAAVPLKNYLIIILENYLKMNRKILLNKCIIKIIVKKIMGYGATAHNRSVYASPPYGGSGFQSARSFRYATLPRLLPPTFLQPWSLLRKALIRAAKMSYTAGTLYAMPPKFFCK
jgi:hypothetical protein